MKKLVMSLVVVSLIFCSLSAKPKKKAKELEAPAGFELFAQEDDLLHLEYKTIKVAKGNDMTKLPACKLSATKDYSKKEPLDIFCDAPEVVKFEGEQCLRLPSNGDGNIRVAWMFDKPIPASTLSEFSFSVGGLDIPEDNTWSWNIALFYDSFPEAGERCTAMYTGPMTTTGLTKTTIDLKTAEGLWGNVFKPEETIIGIQLYYGGRDPIFIKDIELK